MSTQPPSSSQQQQQRQAQAATRERDAAAQSALAPAVSIAPTETLSSAASGPPENVAIHPVAADDNAESLVFEWRQARLGSNQSWGFAVSANGGGSLSGTLEQGTYRKALQGSGSLTVAVIPPAASGTSGSLAVTNDATGATARFTWQWLPAAALSRVAGGVSTGVQAKPVAATRTQSKAALSKQTDVRRAGQSRGSAQTQFFGQVATGRRFAFILDKSGSMEGRRWATCTRELVAALNALTGDAEFFLVLFSSGIFEPPGQKGWTEATADNVAAAIKWISGIHPEGGTEPAPAFKRVYSLSNKADAIYFLTDGELFGFDAAQCKRLRESSGDSGGLFGSLAKMFSSRGGQDDWDPVINTVSLDEDASARELQKIAEDSGGSYVHMSSTPT